MNFAQLRRDGPALDKSPSQLSLHWHSPLIALGAALLAAAAQWLVFPITGNRVPFLFFIIATCYAATFVGTWPAILVIVLGGLNATLQFHLGGTLHTAGSSDLTALGVFIITGLTLAAGGGAVKRRMDTLRTRAANARHDRLQEAEARVRAAVQSRAVLDQSPMPFCLLKPELDQQGQALDFIWTYANPATFEDLELPAAARSGERLSSTLPALWDAPGFREGLSRVLAERELHRFEVKSLREERWYGLVSWQMDDSLALWISDVTEDKRKEEHRLDSERKKDQFIATLAHELRNPLAPIKQAAALLESGTIDGEGKRWAADVIRRQTAVMSWLLEDLLDMSRIALGKLVLRREEVELAQVVETAVQTVKPVMSSRGHHLAVRILTPGVWLFADPVRIAQIIGNLLTNAAKYTPHGGHIELSVESRERGLDICVSDTGIGIEPDHLEDIFSLYRQVEGGYAPTHDGLGLGLAIVKGLVELHGGRVHAQSAGAGQGARFLVHLPGDCRMEPPAREQAQPAAQPGTRRVLVADDNRDAADTLSLLLSTMGHTVDVVYDGLQAVERWKTMQPQVAILDIGMPGLDGYQVARAIRALPQGDGTRLIALSGWGQPIDRTNSEEAGFDVHFTKPVDMEQLGKELK